MKRLLAPNGKHIRGTAEWTTGFAEALVYRDDEGHVCVDHTGVDSMFGETETRTMDGETLYEDVDGVMWKESELIEEGQRIDGGIDRKSGPKPLYDPVILLERVMAEVVYGQRWPSQDLKEAMSRCLELYGSKVGEHGDIDVLRDLKSNG